MIEVKMPQLGESVAEGTVTQWHVKVGDAVRREQPLLEVATDKADTDVPSPSAGKIAAIAAKEGDVVPSGGVLCTIDESAAAGDKRTEPPAANAKEPPPAERPTVRDGPAPAEREPAARPLTTPSTRQLAREQGVDLSAVRGTGERGRVTMQDVRRAAAPAEPAPKSDGQAERAVAPSLAGAVPSAMGARAYEETFAEEPARAAARQPIAEQVARSIEAPQPAMGLRSYKLPPYEPQPGDELVPFTRRRRITADHMVFSLHTAPHVVAVAEIDMQAVSILREAHRAAFEKDGIGLTFLVFVVAATIKALREHPVLNARVLEDSYVKLKDINLGVAVDTEGGLLVANVKHADELSLRGLARAIDELAKRAKSGKITADDLRGTTFTISNPGKKGNLFGGAIISQPNVAILRIGEIKKRPVVVTERGEDRIAIHPMMYAALSYDHRIVDGVEANAFLWRIADLLGRGEIEVGLR